MRRNIPLPKVLLCMLLLIFLGSIPGTLNALHYQQNLSSIEFDRMSMADLFYKVQVGKKISVDLEDETIDQALKQISRETGLRLTYSGGIMEDKKITLKNESISVSDALADVLEGTGFEPRFSQDGYLLVVEAGEKLDALGNEIILQETVQGTVTDEETGETLPGVNIIIKGTSAGTTTNLDGEYDLEVADSDAVLVFSYVGYVTQEIAVGDQDIIDVSMEADFASMEEMVVVGYGSAQARDLTGSIARVDLEQSALQPNVNVVQSLRGTVPGVNIVDNGRPGSDASITIRGQNSISASNNPLIVLDGVVFAGGSISDINPNDIKSIDILKDASSSAIYGSLAANGVILITTKKGTTSEPKIAFNSYYGISDFAHIPNYLNAEQYLQVRKDAEIADGGSIPFVPLEQANIDAGNSINPFEEIKQRAPVSTNELSVSGRSDIINYYISGAYANQKSPVMGDNFDRISTRINLDVSATNWLSIGTNSGYSARDNSGNRANLQHTTYLSPFADLYYEDGLPRPLPMNIGLVSNPLTATLLHDNLDQHNTLFTNTYVNVQLPFEGLSYKLNVGYTQSDSRNYNYVPSFSREEFHSLGSGNKSIESSQDLSFENVLRYDEVFSNDHSINLTLLYGGYISKDEGSYSSSDNIFNDALGYNSLEIGDNYNIETWAGKDQQLSMMSRFGYRYKGKYIADLTIRRDGYSAFGPNNKYAVFPAVGLSWNIFEEEFIRRIEDINNLKIRVSWGKNGNQGVGRNSALSLMGQANYVFGGNTSMGLYPLTLNNPNLGWETTTSTNIGIDFGLFSNRIWGSAEYYSSYTNDLLLTQSIPNPSGFNSILTNIGETENKGIEFQLNTANIQKGTFNWNTTLVFSLNRNKITKLDSDSDDLASGWFIGHPLGSNFDYVFDGIWQEGDDFSLMPEAKPGDVRYRDITGDGNITTDDRQVLHSNQPDFISGITNTLSYKGMSLMVMFNVRQGGYSPNLSLNHGRNYYSSANILDVPYWTPENPINTHPAISYTNPRGYGFYESRSFVRLQDVSLSYELPVSVLERINVERFQIYISGKNLITWTNWNGWDPEFGGDGFGAAGRNPGSNGPLLRTYTMGLKLQL